MFGKFAPFKGRQTEESWHSGRRCTTAFRELQSSVVVHEHEESKRDEAVVQLDKPPREQRNDEHEGEK